VQTTDKRRKKTPKNGQTTYPIFVLHPSGDFWFKNNKFTDTDTVGRVLFKT